MDYAEKHCDLAIIEIFTDFQLQIEHALDLVNRRIVLFVDASVACTNAFDFNVLEPEKDKSYTTHAMSPAAVLDVYRSIKNQMPPPCFLLSIKAEQFELGDGLTASAQANLAEACLFAARLLSNPDVEYWMKLAK